PSGNRSPYACQRSGRGWVVRLPDSLPRGPKRGRECMAQGPAGAAETWRARWRGPPDAPGTSVPPAARAKRGQSRPDLQFAGGESQSRMRTFQPGHLLIVYSRTMMAALLFRPQPALIGMIGLGGGSQAKFCHSHVPATRVEVAENNP